MSNDLHDFLETVDEDMLREKIYNQLFLFYRDMPMWLRYTHSVPASFYDNLIFDFIPLAKQNDLEFLRVNFYELGEQVKNEVICDIATKESQDFKRVIG